MAIGNTKTTVINSTATASSYTGSFTTANASDFLLIWLAGYKSTITDTPATALTVTLGGVTAVLERDSNATNVGDWIGLWKVPVPPGGANTLTVSGVSFRSLSAVIEAVSGYDTGTPIAASGQVRSSSNQASIAFTRTPTAIGNLLSSGMINRCVSTNVPTTVAAEIATTGGATMFPAAAAATGGVTTNDHIFACASEIVAAIAADGHGYAWTTAGRPDLIWVEMNVGAPSLDYTASPADLTLSGETASWMFAPDFEATPADLTLAGVPASYVVGVVQTFTLDEKPFDGFIFDSADKANADFVFTGKGSTGDSIQIRGESAGGNTSWSSGATVDGLGNWTATLSVPRAQWGNWYTPVARIGTNDATKVTGTNKVGGGGNVLNLGQSELEFTMNTGGFYSGVTKPSLRAENMVIITQQSVGGAIVKTRLTSATASGVNVAMIALANFLDITAPGVKFGMFDGAVVGTSRAGLMATGDDAGGGRTMADIQSMINLVRNYGSEIGTVMECWYNADAATLQSFGPEWSPFYMGQRWGGGAFTLGTANPDSTRNPGTLVDFCLWDITAASNVQGRGQFSRDRTKYLMLAPLPFFDTSNGTEQTNFSDTTNGGSRLADLDRPTRDTLAAFIADSRVQTFALGYGPSMHICDFGGDIHPVVDSEWGVALFGRNYGPGMLKAAGVTVGEPTIIATETASDGSYADVIIDLPNGGNLSTIRTLNGFAAPGTQPPHYQQAIGFEIRRASDTDAQRRPIFKTSETTYPVNYRGTAVISDAGTGVAPNRRGRVRITPQTPFAATGDRLEYLRGEANAHLLEPRDVTAQTFMDMLIEHVPAWYDNTRLYPYQGVPVKPQPPVMTLTRITSFDFSASPADLTLAGVAADWTLGLTSYTASPADLSLAGVTASWTFGIAPYTATPADLALSGVVAAWNLGGAGPLIGSFGDRPISGKIIGGSFG